MKALSDCRLYAFVDTAYLGGRAPDRVAAELCNGGADLIQLRAKGMTQPEVRALAERIIPITRRANVGLVINDFPSLALELGSEFCHLGQEDFFGGGYKHVQDIRPPGSRLGIGLSTHRPDDAQRAVAAGADYIAIGPVYATATKPTASPVTLDYVRWAAATVSVPWFAIGGINMKNIDDVLNAGARRICVVSAILGAADIARACGEFRSRLDRVALT